MVEPVQSSSAVSTIAAAISETTVFSSFFDQQQCCCFAEESGEERQILNRSVVDIHRQATNPPANTTTETTISRHVLTDGNGITLLRLSSISSSADSDMIRQPMITEEEWNGAQHAYQKTMDDPNYLGRYKLKARLRRKKC